MNKNNAAQFLPLVQALADGKTIQLLHTVRGWEDAENIDFSCPPESYRIKPDPREFWIYRDQYDGPYIASPQKPKYDWNEIIRVREILD
jgi:hypothetical protein